LARLALDSDVAAVGLYQLAGDGQSQATASTARMGAGAVPAPKAVKNVGQILGQDALAGVTHSEAHTVTDPFPAQGDGAAGGRVAQRVGHQVAEHLVQPARVGGDLWQSWVFLYFDAQIRANRYLLPLPDR